MANPIVTIEMENGDIMKAELYPEVAPNTVNNFVSLVKKGYYDGLIFHRVINGFMIQGGCPDGTGMGGPGYSIKGEFAQNGFANELAHTEGVLSMARAMLAMERTPGVCFRSFLKRFWENSPLMLYPGPPIPVPSGQPPWIIKPLITRWKISPS